MRLVLGAGRLEPQHAQDQLGRFLKQPDQRPEDEEEPADRGRQPERRPLGMAERDPFRHELADHDVQVRDDQQREDDGEERRHHRVETAREHLFAECADGQRGDRHAELHRGDEARRVARDAQHGSGAAIALVLELHDPRAPRGDEPVLGRDEERVQEEQPEQGQHLQDKGHRSWRQSGARVLGGRSSSTRISERSITAGWTTRTDVLSSTDARRLPRRTVPGRAQPRAGHALRVVAQPVHGLRPSLHLLLRPRLRAARRPSGRRPLRHVDPRQAERRRSAALRAAAHRAARRRHSDRRRHRSVPARRRAVPAHARLHRGAARRRPAVLDHHPRPADRA